MLPFRLIHFPVLSLVVVAVLAAGCARRPATATATTPAPTGQAATTPQPDRPRTGAPTATTPAAPGAPAIPGAPATPRAPTAPPAAGATPHPDRLRTGAPPAATPAAPGAPATPGAPTAPPGGTPSTRPGPPEFVAVSEVKDIHFDFDKYDIRPDDARTLDDNAHWMKANPGYLVLVEAHADERGTNEYNLALGERRARAAMNYLAAQGVQALRFTVISYGEERPVCRERTEACWARNRRAHFLVKPQ